MSAPAASATLRTWSTAQVPDGERLGYWVDAISDGFLAMEAHSPQRGGFHSELRSAPLGEVGVNRVRGSAQHVYRTPRGIARSREHFHYLLGNLDSAWVAEQDGRRVRLLPGDFVLVDSQRCYAFHFEEGPSTVSLELPPAWTARWLADPAAQMARCIDGRQGWGAALSAFARQWQPELALAPPLPAALLTDQLGSLLALACGETADSDSPLAARSLREQVQDQIAQRLAEPGLTAADVAGRLGVSVRSLHRALAAGEQTFATCLAQQRMTAARRMLAAPQLDRLSVGEIGRRVGLLDPSHFVRQCKRLLGSTPQALRRQRD
jgi:AraC family transcriptional activator of tynA and feaB